MNKKVFSKSLEKKFQITVALLLILNMTIHPAFCAFAIIFTGNFTIEFDTNEVTLQQAEDCGDLFELSLSQFQSYGFRNPRDLPLTVEIERDALAAAWKWWFLGWWFWITLPPDLIGANAKHIILHELFHTVQFAYPGTAEVFGQTYSKWVVEGQARMMQDKTFPDADLWDGSERASYWVEVGNYLHNTGVTLGDLSYRACLFWTYFTERLGSIRTEPDYGIDALVEWWRHASDEYGGVETTRRTLEALTEPDLSFEELWEDFIVTNYLKDLDGVQSKYHYVDQDQYEASGAPLPSVGRWMGEVWDWGEPTFPRVKFEHSGPLFPNHRIEASSHVDKWAARYYRITPRSGVDLVRFSVVSNQDLFYYVIKAKDDRFCGMVHSYGREFSRTIVKGDCDEIVMIVGGVGRGSNYHYVIEPLTHTIDVTWPTTESPAQVEGDPPLRDFELRVHVMDQRGTPIRGLQPGDFDITVGLPFPDAPKLPVTILQFLNDPPGEANYAFLIRPPRLTPWYDVSSVQFYDLNVGIGDVVIAESEALDYGIHGQAPPPLLMSLFLTPYVFALEEEEYGLQGKPVVIRVNLIEKGPVIEANVIAEITTPSKWTPWAILPPETYSMTLYDDGAHEDGAAGDGIYGNIFYKTSRSGSYTVEAEAEGWLPELASFVEKMNGTFNVETDSDLDGDELPSWWEGRMGLDPGKPVGDQGAAGDPDMDGLSNIDEFELGTHPLDSDTDSGGESDKSEGTAGRDPCDPSDDTIPSVDDFDVKPGNGFNLVIYTPRPEYQTMLIWRSTNPQSGFELIGEGVYLNGMCNDSMVQNDVTYYYRIAAKGPMGEMTRIEPSESATPKTDVDPPRGSVTINHDEKFTKGLDVELTLNADLDVTHMMISDNPRFTEAQWEPYQTSRSWRLEGPGPQAVYVRFQDSSGNIGDEAHDGIIVIVQSISVDKTFKPDRLSQKRKGAVMGWTHINNTGYLSWSEITFSDTILDGWTIKDRYHTISTTLFIDGTEYKISYDELTYAAVEGDKYIVNINFAAGVDLYQFNAASDTDEYRMTIYAFEPKWLLTIKYPMHPPTDLLAGNYQATVSITAANPEVITFTVDGTATLHVTERKK